MTDLRETAELSITAGYEILGACNALIAKNAKAYPRPLIYAAGQSKNQLEILSQQPQLPKALRNEAAGMAKVFDLLMKG